MHPKPKEAGASNQLPPPRCMMSNHEQREPDFGPGDAPGGRSQSDGGPGCTWGGLALAQELSQVQIATPSKSRSHGHSTLSWMWSLLRKLCPHGRTQLSASARLSKLEDGAVHKFKSSKPPHSSRWLNITVKTTPTGPQMHNLFFLVSLFTGSSSTLARLLLIILLKLFIHCCCWTREDFLKLSTLMASPGGQRVIVNAAITRSINGTLVEGGFFCISLLQSPPELRLENTRRLEIHTNA